MQDTNHAKDRNSFDLVLFLWARRNLIIGVTVLGAIAGVVAAFVIRPLYKSEVIMFPAITQSASKALLNEQSTGRDDILALGDEEDSEQLLQILNSDRIRDRVAQAFDLFTVYRVKPDSRHRNTELREAYEDHIKFEYTKFSSVRAEVLDEDPVRAADIANYIADQVDSVWKEMANERAEKGFNIVNAKVRGLEDEIAQMADSMRILRELGVHDYHTQTERYNEYLGAAIVKGDQRAIKEFEERRERFSVTVMRRGGEKQLVLEVWGDQANQPCPEAFDSIAAHGRGHIVSLVDYQQVELPGVADVRWQCVPQKAQAFTLLGPVH